MNPSQLNAAPEQSIGTQKQFDAYVANTPAAQPQAMSNAEVAQAQNYAPVKIDAPRADSVYQATPVVDTAPDSLSMNPENLLPQLSGSPSPDAGTPDFMTSPPSPTTTPETTPNTSLTTTTTTPQLEVSMSMPPPTTLPKPTGF